MTAHTPLWWVGPKWILTKSGGYSHRPHLKLTPMAKLTVVWVLNMHAKFWITSFIWHFSSYAIPFHATLIAPTASGNSCDFPSWGFKSVNTVLVKCCFVLLCLPYYYSSQHAWETDNHPLSEASMQWCSTNPWNLTLQALLITAWTLWTTNQGDTKKVSDKSHW